MKDIAGFGPKFIQASPSKREDKGRPGSGRKQGEANANKKPKPLDEARVVRPSTVLVAAMV